MPDLRNYALLALLAVCTVLGLGAWQYKRMYNATNYALKTQSAAIERQNKAAKDEYETLKKDRDALQSERNALAKKLESQGEQDKTKIADDGRRDTAPVVVRYITRYARSCGEGGSGGGAGAVPPGAGDPAVSSGLLAPEAEKLAARDRDDVERLQAAFNNCAAKVSK